MRPAPRATRPTAGAARSADQYAPEHARDGAPGGAGTTDFGYRQVPEQEKSEHVAGVFHSVARNYDLMNDLMSAGLHRWWKAFTIRQAQVRPGMKVLDVAGGTGDLALRFARQAGPQGEVWLTDINGSMLAQGRDRMLDAGVLLPVAQCDAERLPFAAAHFDVVTVALLLVLEFSRVWAPLSPLYDAYSFNVLPWLGRKFAGDSDSYRYLAESIRMHPPQDELARLMEQSGLERVQWFNLTAGVCALHVGYRH